MLSTKMSRSSLLGVTLLLFILTSCTAKKQTNEKTTEVSSIFPIEYIAQVAPKRQLSYNLGSKDYPNLKRIDSLFFKKWFNNLAANNTKFKIEFDEYSRYYFFDYQDFDKKFLFSILHNDEVGYNNLFHFTFDKEKKKIVQVDFIAQTGSDGGDSNADVLQYNKEGDMLMMTSISTSSQDVENGYVREYDSTLTKIEFDLPITKYKQLYIFSKTDTIQHK
jgi:hypothetical protein